MTQNLPTNNKDILYQTKTSKFFLTYTIDYFNNSHLIKNYSVKLQLKTRVVVK